MNERNVCGPLCVPQFDAGTRSMQYTVSVAVLVLASFLAAGGCERTSVAVATKRATSSPTQWSDELFSFATANLNSLEDNDCSEMLKSTHERLIALEHPEFAAGVLPSNALLASWPEPDMLRQVVSRLNQWVDTLEKPAPSKPDPMLASLPPDFAKSPLLAEADLNDVHFSAYDGYSLMETVWLRDVERWAKGDGSNDLDTARNLFDWTVRNIQIDEDRPERVPQVPWETLFLGHGTATERAWTFILLLRQCDIDAAVLALPAGPAAPAADKDKKDAGKPARETPAELRPWCVAVLIGDKDKILYLFEPQLGVPIPAPNGPSAGRLGRLEVTPATLDQIIADRNLLNRLSPDSTGSYWAAKADVKRAVALLEASPLYLEPRAKRMQASLTGERKMVLTAEPTQQADRFKAAGIADVRLWELPYTTLQRGMAMKPAEVSRRLQSFLGFIGLGGGGLLYKGRILHLKGRFFDEKGAIAYYQKARPRTRDAMAQEAQRVDQYLQAQVAREKELGHELTPQRQAELKAYAQDFFNTCVKSVLQGKIDAAYWLGLIMYEQGEYESSVDYFYNRTLLAGGSSVFWRSGAFYNMARCHEADGKWPDALQEYETNARLYKDEGSLLRAQWLRDVHGAKPEDQQKKTDETQPEAKSDEKKSEEKKADEKVTEDRKPLDGRDETKKGLQEKADTKQSDLKKADEKKPAEEPHEPGGPAAASGSSNK